MKQFSKEFQNKKEMRNNILGLMIGFIGINLYTSVSLVRLIEQLHYPQSLCLPFFIVGFILLFSAVKQLNPLMKGTLVIYACLSFLALMLLNCYVCVDFSLFIEGFWLLVGLIVFFMGLAFTYSSFEPQ